jgi:EAL domain-containing protein (putative c-di-GMP-specific phosphodiesterase class I)
VQALVTFARSSGAQLVAEGLETEAQIRAVRSLGVRYGQGFALCHPRRLQEGAAPTVVPTVA